jgi:hypothetical protein
MNPEDKKTKYQSAIVEYHRKLPTASRTPNDKTSSGPATSAKGGLPAYAPRRYPRFQDNTLVIVT